MNRREFFQSAATAALTALTSPEGLLAQALVPLDLACVVEMARFRADESVGQALMIALSVIMGDEVLNC